MLTTSARDAERIVDALVPLARAGELDAKLVRVLRYRRLWACRTVTVTVASTGVLPTARAVSRCVSGRLRVGVPAERVRRGDVGSADDAVDHELDPRRLAGDVDAPEHEPGHLLARR